MNGRDTKRWWAVWVLACVIAVTLATTAGAAPPDTDKAPAADAAKAPPPPKPGKAPPHKGAAGGPHAKGGPAAPPPPFGYPNGFIERHAKRLELSDETVKAIRDVVEKSRAENERLRRQVDHAQAGLRKLLAQDLPDEKSVMDQADEITELVGEQRKSQLRSAIKVRSMLTPKQRAELDKIRKEQAPPRHAGPGAPPPPPGQKKPPFGGAAAAPAAKPAPQPTAAE